MRRFGALILLWVAVPAAAQGALADTAAWERLGATRQQISALAFSGDPDRPTVWALDSGVYRLDSLGGPWVRVDREPGRAPLLFVSDPFDDAGPDTLFAGAALFRSVDSGRTFEYLGAPAAGPDGRIDAEGALARFPPGSPFAHRLVAGDGFGPLVYSDDGGDTWAASGPPPRHYPFALHAFRSGRALSAGFYGAATSADGGRTWAAVPALYDTTRIGFDLTHVVALPGLVTGRPGDSAEGRVLVLGTEAGRPAAYVWASDDEGATWREAHAFAYDNGVGGVAAVSGSAGGGPGWAVYASKLGAVFATGDGGETWAAVGRVPQTGRAPDGGGAAVTVRAVAVGPDGRLYAGTVRNGPEPSWSWRTRGPVAGLIAGAVGGEGPPGRPPAGAGPGLGLWVWPNPAGGAATVALGLAGPERVRVAVVDGLGREVAVVWDGPAADGQRVPVGTAGLAPGVYRVVAVAASGAAGSAALSVVR